MEFLKTIDFRGIVKTILERLDTEVNLKISTKHRGFRNCVSPSLLQLKDIKKQAHLFFDPDLLRGAGLIDQARYTTLYKNLIPSANMAVNCIIGTFLDAILVDAIAEHLISLGIAAIPQMPAISKETGVFGNADLLIINDDKLYVVDLKTTGNKLIDRTIPELYDKRVFKKGYLGNKGLTLEKYMRQLHAYGLTFKDMFELEVGGVALINLSKVPSSAVPLTEEHFNDPTYQVYISEYGYCSCPLVTMTYMDWDYLDKEYTADLLSLKKEVTSLSKKLKVKYPSFNSWLIDDEEFNRLNSDAETKYNKIIERLGLN